MSNSKRLISNIISLAFVQGAGFLVPLFTLPYLIRVLGPESYGVLVVAQAVVQYFVIFSDYGFNLSATRAISIARDDFSQLSNIFSSVMLLKLLSLLLGFVILIVLISLIKSFQAHWQVYFACYLIVLGNVLFPFWFFQGLEQVRLVSLISVFARFIMFFSILILIKKPEDLLMAAILQSMPGIVSGILALILLKQKYSHIKFIMPSITDLKSRLSDGWTVFITTLSFTAYTSYGILLLGLFFGNATAGYYGAGEKVVRAISQGLFQPIHQALFPHAGFLANQSKEQLISFNKKLITLLAPIFLLLTGFFIFGSGWLVHTILDSRYNNAIVIISLMSLLPLFTVTSGILGANTLLVLGFNREISQIYTIIAVFSLVITSILVILFRQTGAALSAVITEFCVTAMIWNRLKYLKII